MSLIINPYRFATGAPGDLKSVADQPINSGIVFAFAAQPPGSSNAGKDLVTGITGTILGDADFTTRAWPGSPGGAWLGLDARSTASAGLYWPTASTQIKTITTAHTILWNGVIEDSVSHSAVFAVPYRDVVWTSPWTSIRLSRSSTSTFMRSTYAVSNVQVAAANTDGPDVFVPGSWLVGTSRNAGTVKFWNAGSQAGADVTGLDTGAVDFSTAIGPTLQNRSSAIAGEGLDGATYWCIIWNRELSAGEIAAIGADPLTMFVT